MGCIGILLYTDATSVSALYSNVNIDDLIYYILSLKYMGSVHTIDNDTSIILPIG